MLFSPLSGAPLGHGVEVLPISVENYFVEILRPILPEGAVLIKACAVYLGDSCFRVALEPVKFYKVRAELAFGDESLNGCQE